jgi:anti-sigma regulatory factor (Ser/Thr protein kinase)
VTSGFQHEALMYAGDDGFRKGTVPFLREGAAAGQAMLVVVSAARIEMLRDRLGRDARAVQFADMADLGANPARIIPAWRDFADRHADHAAGLRGIGEPIWAARPKDQLVECQRHEALLNVAFATTRSFLLLCPYDVEALDAEVLEEAQRSHPYVRSGSANNASPSYVDAAMAATHLATPLLEPAVAGPTLNFDAAGLSSVRRRVARHAARSGLLSRQVGDLVTAAMEAATNSVVHGGGEGRLRLWTDADAVVCEVSDGGPAMAPLADRQRPAPGSSAGRGLWLANHLCDLVQVRSFPTGNVVRLHVRRR